MKKILSIFLCGVIMLTFAGCKEKKEANKEGSMPGTAYINDCYIEITHCSKQWTRGEGAYAVVGVDFKNNSDKSASLSSTAQIKAFHNGKELELIWMPNGYGDADLYTDSILPGYAISTEYAFALDGDKYVYAEDFRNGPILVQICYGNKVISEKECY